MARIRTIKPEFFQHHELFEAEEATGLPLRLAFAGLWTCADREGRFKWRPHALKLSCLPYDDVDFARVLDALAIHGFIVRYEVDGQAYGAVPSWQKHQTINLREASSKLPGPGPAVHMPKPVHAHATPVHAHADTGNDDNNPLKTLEPVQENMQAHTEPVHAHASTETHVHAHGEGKEKKDIERDIYKEGKEYEEGEPQRRKLTYIGDLKAEDFSNYAKRKAPNVDVERELERYRNWSLQKGKLHKDCAAGFRNWLLKAQEIHQERNGGNGGHQPTGPPAERWQAFTDKQWQLCLKAWIDGKIWNTSWGPSPEQRGCKMPENLLARAGEWER